MRWLVAFMSVLLFAGCSVDEAARETDEKFPLEPHYLIPQYGLNAEEREQGLVQIATGIATGKEAALPQPINFSHNIHAGEVGMDCQYCHSEARRGIHGGVPPVQMCMNCHQHIKTDSPEVQKLHAHYCDDPPCIVMPGDFGPIPPEEAKPIPWKKVHDLPDYVNFAHNRHVKAGVQCTECHGQVSLQGRPEMVPVVTQDENWVYQTTYEEKVTAVMVRETNMQMGWCLDCHASHPSVDTNYGTYADLRRAELKDCWTCHK